ncbi:hypothetical protein [Algoriella sp.]|uniref:hypothetical protein n=1 Tax=Algoriella sp. TaxID=1872434 RepID=UPI001B174595|nr:hypothetical protein [Algoriella sp.]MBO6213609.1 hypothetical protein [Algoriella sp.]
MKKLILIILFSSGLFSPKLTAQDDRKNIVTLSVMSATMQPPRWTVGYIHKINERYWLGAEIGYGSYQTFNLKDRPKYKYNRDYELFEIRPEFYVNINYGGKVKHLISAELFYINHSDRLENGQFYETKKNNWDENHNIYYTYDFADYDRKKYGLNINYSPVFTLFKGVTLMPKAGIGIKHRNINYSNSVNLQEAENASSGCAIFCTDNIYEQNGSDTNLNLNLNFRVAYQF